MDGPTAPGFTPIKSDLPDDLSKAPLAERLQKWHDALEADAKEEPKQYPYYPAFCDNPEKREGFKPAKVAEWLAENENFKRDRNTDILYYYNGKTWSKNGEVYLEEILAKILQDENRLSHFTNILHVLKGLCIQDIHFSNKIATPNGLLDPESLELKENTPEEMPLFSIPTEYIANSEYPQWQEWLNQVMPNKEDQMTLQEWSGYILLADYRFHKLLYNYGGGRNGKGTWERTIQTVIGLDNCSEVGLEEFDGQHRFALYQLYGKLFNSCSEPTTNKVLQTSIIKKVTGQDVISAERKGSDKRLDFTNTAKMTVSANKFPKVNDTSTAFIERRLFLTWANQFKEGEGQIQYIEKNWIEGDHDERKGILCWMLDGLQRLLSQGHFTTSKSQQETELLFQRASDTIGAFLAESAQYGKVYATTRKEAIQSYQDYCEFYSLPPENDKIFTQRLEQTEKISKGKVKGERAWKGVTFKKLIEDSAEGTDGTLLHDYSPTTISDEKKIEGVNGVLSVPSVPVKVVPTVTDCNHSAKSCGRWQTGECAYPGDPSSVQEDSSWCLSCRGWTVEKPKLKDYPSYPEAGEG